MTLGKRYGFGLMMACCSLASSALANDECEPAVDMIESNDAVNRMADCDYRDEGINGWLANLGSDKDELAKEPQAAGKQDAVTTAASASTSAGFVLRSQPAADALSHLQQRFDVVGQAAKRCSPSVAEIVTQAYQADEQGGTVLIVAFRCRQ